MRRQRLIWTAVVISFAMQFCSRQSTPASDAAEPRAVQSETRTQDGAQPQQQSDDDPLERVIKSMRVVHKRIEDRDTGRETRKIQDQIVKDLQVLIDLAKRQRPPRQRQNQPKPMPQQPSNQDKPNGPPSEDKQSADTPTSKTNNQDAANESTERTDEAQKKKAELAQRRALGQEVWGHLPPNLREKMLNIFSEESLPKYKDLVRRYFESLGEPRTEQREN